MQSQKEADQVEMRTTVRTAEDGTKVAVNNDGNLGDSANAPSPDPSARTAALAFNEQTNYVPKKKIITVGGAPPSSEQTRTSDDVHRSS